MNIEDWTKQVQEVAYEYDEEPMEEETVQRIKPILSEYAFSENSPFAAWCRRGNKISIAPANPEMERYFFFWSSSFGQPRERQTSEGSAVLLVDFGAVEGVYFYIALDGTEDVYGTAGHIAHRIGTFGEFLERMLQEVIAGRKLRDAYDQWEEAGDGSNFSPPDDSDYVSLNDYVRRLDDTNREAAKKTAPQG